ncbi:MULTISPECIES: CoA pyrophosphatase [Silvimonas]|uniref:CoA pyrophosphatase n=1 Tax=Silvimonas TaxID=300264 RepID=UPI0024B3AFCF|nr:MULTISPECIES: CoA pyrophosphatase [Silvimonas]MDR3426290.1 CoA pyrophosphatase [Silvimonas sp.]
MNSLAPAHGDAPAWADWLRSQLAQAERQTRGDMGLEQARRAAAVLIPIVPYPDGSRIILTERAAHLRHHGGQISFPGGRVDPQDQNPAATALREANEEIGLLPANVQVLGELGTYHTITGFNVTPVVGLVTPGMALQPEPGEVAAILELPWNVLLNPAHYELRWVERRGLRGKSLFVECGGITVWGATAGMLLMLARALGMPGQPLDTTA